MQRPKILFVDDEPAILHAMRRQLKEQYEIDLAESGAQALQILSLSDPFQVVVSDLRMPGMDGINFLSQVKKKYPDTVRIMLSGNADLDAAIQAVNTDNVFRFLIKPCSGQELQLSLKLAVRQNQLINAERDLLNQTVKGSITMLCEMLHFSNSKAFSLGQKIRQGVVEIASLSQLTPLWQYELSALLCQIGCVGLPTHIQDKMLHGISLTDEEARLFAEHPRIGERIVSKIPRLEKVGSIIGAHLKSYEELISSSLPADVIQGASIIKAMLDYTMLLNQKITKSEAIARLYKEKATYNPDILEYLPQLRYDFGKGSEQIIEIMFDDLLPGMRAAEDILASNGNVIITKDQVVTWPLLEGLHCYIKHIGIKEPFRVWQANN